MCEPSELWVLIQDGNACFLCYREVENDVQQLQGVALHLQHFARLVVLATIARNT
jgi:hypothetical protein